MVPNGIQWARMGVHAAARPSAFNAIERAFYFRAAAWHGVHACNAPGAPLLIFRQNPAGAAGGGGWWWLVVVVMVVVVVMPQSHHDYI